MGKTRGKPQFFKFFIPGRTDKRIEIPRAFLKHLEHNSGTAALKGPTGSSWHVKLIEKENGLFLKTGWKKFVRDHCIDAGYFLLFKYDGGLKFTVSIFDTSACEREYASSKNSSSKASNQTLNDAMGISRKKRRVAGKRPLFQKIAPEPKTEAQELSVGPPPGFPAQPAAFTKSDFSRLISQRRSVSPEEIARTYAAAKAFKSENPIGLVVMRVSFVYYGFYMRLPVTFPVYALPRVPSRVIVLYDPSGKPWNVNFLYRGRTHSALSAGWKAFAHGNNLEEHDICIFEVMKSNQIQKLVDRTVLQAHFGLFVSFFKNQQRDQCSDIVVS